MSGQHQQPQVEDQDRPGDLWPCPRCCRCRATRRTPRQRRRQLTRAWGRRSAWPGSRNCSAGSSSGTSLTVKRRTLSPLWRRNLSAMQRNWGLRDSCQKTGNHQLKFSCMCLQISFRRSKTTRNSVELSCIFFYKNEKYLYPAPAVISVLCWEWECPWLKILLW